MESPVTCVGKSQWFGAPKPLQQARQSRGMVRTGELNVSIEGDDSFKVENRCIAHNVSML